MATLFRYLRRVRFWIDATFRVFNVTKGSFILALYWQPPSGFKKLYLYQNIAQKMGLIVGI